MLLQQFQKMNFSIFLSILFHGKKRQKHIRKRIPLVKCNTLLHYQHQPAWEILFNYQVCSLFDWYYLQYYFRWSNHSITSKFIIKYCHYGCKFKSNSFLLIIKKNFFFFRVHKVLNNNIQLVLKQKRISITISFVCAMLRCLTLLCINVLCKETKKNHMRISLFFLFVVVVVVVVYIHISFSLLFMSICWCLSSVIFL